VVGGHRCLANVPELASVGNLPEVAGEPAMPPRWPIAPRTCSCAPARLGAVRIGMRVHRRIGW